MTLSNREFDIAHSYSDFRIIEDYSEYNSIKKAIKEFNCDYLIPGSNDFSMIACSLVAEQLGLPGYDSHAKTKQLHYKSSLRRLQASLGIPHPRFFVVGKDHRFKYT